MDAKILVKISRDNIPAGRRSPGHSKRRWRDLIPIKTVGSAYNKEEEGPINTCLDGTQSKVRVGNHFSSSFPNENDLKQGDVLLPLSIML